MQRTKKNTRLASEWPFLPTKVLMPEVSVGESAETTIPLPNSKPGDREEFFVYVRMPLQSDSFSVYPVAGVMGGDDGIRELFLKYTPKSYGTMIIELNIHLPVISETPYTVKVYTRSRPGFRSDKVRKELEKLEKTKLPRILPPKRLVEPRMFLTVWEGFNEDIHSYVYQGDSEEDVTKPAGIVHFLLRRNPRRRLMSRPICTTSGLEVPPDKAQLLHHNSNTKPGNDIRFHSDIHTG